MISKLLSALRNAEEAVEEYESSIGTINVYRTSMDLMHRAKVELESAGDRFAGTSRQVECFYLEGVKLASVNIPNSAASQTWLAAFDRFMANNKAVSIAHSIAVRDACIDGLKMQISKLDKENRAEDVRLKMAMRYKLDSFIEKIAQLRAALKECSP